MTNLRSVDVARDHEVVLQDLERLVRDHVNRQVSVGSHCLVSPDARRLLYGHSRINLESLAFASALLPT